MSINRRFRPRTRCGAVIAAAQTGLASIALPALTGPACEPDARPGVGPEPARAPGSNLLPALSTLPVVFAAITLASALTPPGGAAPSWPDGEDDPCDHDGPWDP